MPETSRINRITSLCAVLTLATALCAAAAPPSKPSPPKAPPPPPKTGNFPLPKHKSRPPRIITLKPGQTEPTPEDLKHARPLYPEPGKRPKGATGKQAPPGKKPAKKQPPAKKSKSGKKEPPPKHSASAAVPAQVHLKPYEQYLLQRYPQLAGEITEEGLARHLKALTRGESRVTGYPGERLAAEYVRGQFRELFGETVQEERFMTTVPIDRGGELRLPTGERFPVRALWPNLIRTSQTPTGGLEGPIIWAGSSRLSEFNGRDVAAPEPKVPRSAAEQIVRRSWRGDGRALRFRSARLGILPDASSRERKLAWRVSMLPPEAANLDEQAAPKTELSALVDAVDGRVLTPLSSSIGVPELKRNTGAIVVVEFNTGSDWLNAARLGAEAVVFVEPDETMRGEAENKFLSVPAAIPRYWISRADAARLIPLIQRPNPPQAVLQDDMRWETVDASNFWGRIPGWDPLDNQDHGDRLAGLLHLSPDQKSAVASLLNAFNGPQTCRPTREATERDIERQLTPEQLPRWKEVLEAPGGVIVLHAYYDAISCVPSLAPGAENAVSMATLLELTRLFKQHPPRRTVWFLATTSHFEALGGIRAYLQRHLDEFTAPSPAEQAGMLLTRNAGLLVDLSTVVRWLLVAGCAGLILLGLTASILRRRAGPALAAMLALVPIALLLLTARATPDRAPPRILLFAGLDLSSHSPGVGVFYKGYFYNYREDLQSKFSDLARTLREDSQKVAAVLGQDPKRIFADGVNPTEGKSWRNYVPGKLALDAEAWTLTGARGIAFATVEDGRRFVDTPFDTLDRLEMGNVWTQAGTLACLLDHVLNDSSNPTETEALRVPLAQPSTFSRFGLMGGFASVLGRAVRFDLKESFIPSTPVPGSLAVVTSPDKTLMGVRGAMVQETEPDGRYRFDGVAPVSAFAGKSLTQVQAYHVSPETGEVDFAPDLGQTGAKAYPLEVEMTLAQKHVQVILFPCASTSIYDFVDPQSLKTLQDVRVYDGATNSEPRMYGMALGHPEKLQSFVEDAAVFFAQPGFALKVVMGAGPAVTRFVLIHSTYRRERAYDADGANAGRVLLTGVPEGIGYKLGEQPAGGDRPTTVPGVTPDRTYEGTIPLIPYRVALDMWNWDDANAEKLRKYRIVDRQLDELHNRAGQYLQQAEAAMRDRDWARAYSLSRKAYGYEARAYPEVQNTTRDVVKGVLFYLALLLPFSFFLERLLVGSTNLRNQLLWVFGIFVVAFVLLSQVHPAFDITISPMIVLLAFIMLALSLLVIVLIAGKFDQQVKAFNHQLSGAHNADIGRAGIAAAAFSLGISNMRRRGVRTLLTCVTLVLLTFIVLSFTSVVTGIRYNVVPAPGTPRYNGVLLRSQLWEPLQETSYRLLKDEFGAEHTVAPRAWFFGAQSGEQTLLTLTRGDQKYETRAALGLTPGEREMGRGVERALYAGRWLTPADIYATILPREAAEALGITADEVNAGTASLRYGGTDYAVVGLLDSAAFKRIQDLDGEPLTPVDFILAQSSSPGGGMTKRDPMEGGYAEYTHLEPGAVFILPYETLMRQGGQVRSVAVNLGSPETVRATRLDLMPRLGLNLYAGEGGQTFRYSAMGGTSIAGAGTLVVPILIAALIVLNTMLGAVFERQKEIHIFSSIGLAPNHVAMLFMAEALVYAVLGAMAGYLLGQGMAKVIVALHLFPGLNLNFSSLSAVFSTALVMGVVLLSTIYPARKAGEVATPALERTWRTPEPDGDRWEIPLPFMVTGGQASGLNAFLGEWFRAYEEYSVGDFVTQGVESTEEPAEAGTAYRIRLTAWLAPFDLGVSQHVELRTTPTDMEDVYELRLVLQRLTGDTSNWKRVNRRFLNTLRKQFLIWRTLRTEERERYLTARPEGTSI